VKIENFGRAITSPPPPVPEIIQDGILIEQGKAVLFGIFKAGKSTLAHYISCCIAGGLPLFGKYQCAQSRVLHIQMEMSHLAFLNKMYYSSLSKSQVVRDNLWISTDFTLKLDRQDGVDELCRAIEAVQPKVVVLDAFYKALSGAEDYEHTTRATDNLDIIIDRYGCAVLLVSQARKTQIVGGSIVDLGDQELRGHTSLPGWVDSILGLRRAAGTKRKLSLTLRQGKLGNAEITINYDVNTGLYSIA